jgi:hypothetical protein
MEAHPPELGIAMKVSSVKKKLKERSFAPGVSREDVYGAEEVLGLPLDEFIGVAIAGVQQVAPDIGLRAEGRSPVDGEVFWPDCRCRATAVWSGVRRRTVGEILGTAGHNRGMGRTDSRVVYAALGDSLSIDDYAGGPGQGAASLLWRNRDDDFPAWAGRDLTSRDPSARLMLLVELPRSGGQVRAGWQRMRADGSFRSRPG